MLLYIFILISSLSKLLVHFSAKKGKKILSLALSSLFSANFVINDAIFCISELRNLCDSTKALYE